MPVSDSGPEPSEESGTLSLAVVDVRREASEVRSSTEKKCGHRRREPDDRSYRFRHRSP